MLQVKVYFEVYPGQKAENIYVQNMPLTHEKIPGYKRYVATIEVPENDGTDATPVPRQDVKVEEIS